MAYEGDKKRAYQLAFLKRRRDDWISANGPCQLCGSTEDLEVDHVVPRKIAGGISSAGIWSRRKDTREAELAKCRVLCKRCHKRKSNEESRTPFHGSAKYRTGCRCEVCRKAQRERMRRLRGTDPSRIRKP